MSGQEVLQALRANPATVGVPVLILTGQPELTECGANETLAKPFDLAGLRSRVNFWLTN